MRLRVRIVFLIIMLFSIGSLLSGCTPAKKQTMPATSAELIKQSKQHTLWMFSSETNLTQVADAGQNASGLVRFKQQRLIEQPNDSWQNGPAKTPDWGSDLQVKYSQSDVYQLQGKTAIRLPKGSVLFANGLKVIKTINGRNNGGFHYEGFKVALLNQSGHVMKTKSGPVMVILIYKVL